MSNKFYSTEFKYEVIMAYKNGEHSLREILSKYQIPSITLYSWMEKFEREGLEGLVDSNTWKQYFKELKESAVQDYLSGKYSQYEIIRKYGISSRGVLQQWIKKVSVKLPTPIN